MVGWPRIHAPMYFRLLRDIISVRRLIRLIRLLILVYKLLLLVSCRLWLENRFYTWEGGAQNFSSISCASGGNAKTRVLDQTRDNYNREQCLGNDD